MTEEIPGIPGWFWQDDFDLSALSYPQFLDFFFDRPIVGEEKEYDLFRGGIDEFTASNPATVVAHVQTMCRDFSELAKRYSHKELDQGLWAVFGAGISCQRFVFDPAVQLERRIDCIEAMYHPFKDVVARGSLDRQESFYWMWWDMILHTFWHAADEYTFNYAALSADRKQVLDAIYRTLLKILALNHRGCQWSALHGLGHLHHPLGPEAVQRYLDVHREELTGEDVQWVEACRDGRIA